MSNEEGTSSPKSPDRPRGLIRWVAVNLGTAIPQSMAPITFGLATLSQGSANGGALMVMAMVAAQVVGAVPITAAGRRFAISIYVRILATYRTLAFVALAVAVALGAPLCVLVVAAGFAGLVNGAIFGLLRAILNDMVASGKLPRALGIAATANELVFVVGPIIASTVGVVSVTTAVGMMALASTLPVVLLPRIPHPLPQKSRVGRRESMPLGTIVWLLASTSSSACVASVEVGALALALRYQLAPSDALFFTVPLCLASVSGGMWISIRNRRLGQRTIVLALLLIAGGALTMGLSTSVAAAIAGIVVMGLFVAPLGMSYSLSLEDILPKSRRAEGFALLRTSNSVGVIVASSAIAFGTLTTSFLVAAALALLSGIFIVATEYRRREGRGAA